MGRSRITARQLTILAHRANGLTVAEIAQRIERSASAVESTLSRAVSQIVEDAAEAKLPTVYGEDRYEVCAKLGVNLRYLVWSNRYMVHPRHTILTHRERELLSEVAKGKRLAVILAEQFVEENTFRTLMRRARKKLGAPNNTNAVAKAVNLGILDGDDLR